MVVNRIKKKSVNILWRKKNVYTLARSLFLSDLHIFLLTPSLSGHYWVLSVMIMKKFDHIDRCFWTWGVRPIVPGEIWKLWGAIHKSFINNIIDKFFNISGWFILRFCIFGFDLKWRKNISFCWALALAYLMDFLFYFIRTLNNIYFPNDKFDVNNWSHTEPGKILILWRFLNLSWRI